MQLTFQTDMFSLLLVSVVGSVDHESSMNIFEKITSIPVGKGHNMTFCRCFITFFISRGTKFPPYFVLSTSHSVTCLHLVTSEIGLSGGSILRNKA
jgi:hypothetical protein